MYYFLGAAVNKFIVIEVKLTKVWTIRYSQEKEKKQTMGP